MLTFGTPLEFYEYARAIFYEDPLDYLKIVDLIDCRGWSVELEDPIEDSMASKEYPHSPNMCLPIYEAMLVEVGFAIGFMHSCLDAKRDNLPTFPSNPNN